MEKKFKKGEIVWAKVKGFPWWPGRIKSVSLKLKQTNKDDPIKTYDYFYMIDFFGDCTHVELPSDKVENFTDNYTQFSKTRQKKLINSIESAKKLLLSQQNSSCENSNEDYLNSNTSNKTAITLEKGISNIFLGRKTQNSFSPPSQSKLRDININININVTNRNNNPLNFQSLSEISNAFPSMINEGTALAQSKIEKGNEDEEKDNGVDAIDRKKNKIKEEEEDNEEEDEDDEEDDETPEDKLKKTINSFLRYRIDNSSAKRAQVLLTSIEEIENNLKDITSSTYSLTKDIISVLMCFTSNTNQELFIKSSQLLDTIREKIIKELFEMNTMELNQLPDKANNRNINNQFTIVDAKSLKEEIIDFDNKKDNQDDKKRRNKKKNEGISSSSVVNEIGIGGIENEEKQSCEKDNDISDLIQILNAGSYQKAMNIFEIISNDFFNNSYNKKDSQLDKQNAKLRKYLCLKLKQKIQQIVPNWDINGIQRMVIYFEYKQRTKDMTFGKKYLQHLKNLSDVIDSLRSNNQQKGMNDL